MIRVLLTILAGVLLGGIVVLGRLPDPSVLDLTRNGKRHLQFGYGMHHCMGAALARMEIVEVLRARWPVQYVQAPPLARRVDSEEAVALLQALSESVAEQQD